MVNIFSFKDLFIYSQIHGYFFIFLIMIVEGPIMTVTGAFAASLGYLNIWAIFILSFFGDVVGDALAYSLGYFGGKKFLNKYENLFGIKKRRIENLRNHFENHLGKTLFVIKATPLSFFGLMVAGVSRISPKRYAFWNVMNILPRTIFFVGLGYFFGNFSKSILHIYGNLTYYVLALIFFVLIIDFLWRKIFKNFLK